MRFHNLYILIMLAALFGILGCGDDSDDSGLYLSGTYSLSGSDQNTDSPVLVILTNSIDADLLENDSRDIVIEYMVADTSNQTFRMDLSNKNIKPEDKVKTGFASKDTTGVADKFAENLTKKTA